MVGTLRNYILNADISSEKHGMLEASFAIQQGNCSGFSE